ncbi:MAG: hypothetical protein EXS13_13935 [Planctomycetes bacterium]|nr:hypothetical protein [Planctomycetota bacterium]
MSMLFSLTLAWAVAADPSAGNEAIAFDASAFEPQPQAVPAAAPAALDAPTMTAAEFWTPWAAKHKYKLAPTADGRLLLLIPQERSKLERSQELVQKALARVDAVLPAPVSVTSAAAPVLAEDNPIPWGSADRVLDTDTMVLGLFRKPAEFAAALTALGKAFPYMAAWTTNAKGLPGCILERPLFGACVDNVPGMEEWNPDNELVHRAGQLAMIRRFGRQPVWVGLGVGWNVEFDILKSIYCFPWRNSFVWATEHSGWENDLRRRFKKQEDQPVEMADLAEIERGSFEVKDAALAWGTMRFLMRHYDAQLPSLLFEFQARRDVLGRIPTGSGKDWTMAADFELPADEQQKAFDRRVAPGVLAQAADWFRQGDHWKKPAGTPPPH